jgi:hypothetical protein
MSHFFNYLAFQTIRVIIKTIKAKIQMPALANRQRICYFSDTHFKLSEVDVNED